MQSSDARFAMYIPPRSETTEEQDNKVKCMAMNLSGIVFGDQTERMEMVLKLDRA